MTDQPVELLRETAELQVKRVIDKALVGVSFTAPGDPEPYWVAPSDPLLGVAGLHQSDVDRLTAAVYSALIKAGHLNSGVS